MPFPMESSGMTKPYPVPERELCSECGLAWSDHPEGARRRDCIELLMGELVIAQARQYWTTPQFTWTTGSGTDLSLVDGLEESA